MARPIKVGIDYFPRDVTDGDKFGLLEAKYGSPAPNVITKLWQKIYSEGYYTEWDEDISLLFASKIIANDVNFELVNAIVNDSLRRNLFDLTLYNTYGILTSEGIQQRYFDICINAKRKKIKVYNNYLLIKIEKRANFEFLELTRNKQEFTQEETKVNSVTDGINGGLIPKTNELSTQSKVKDIKVYNIKEKDKGFDVPERPSYSQIEIGEENIICANGELAIQNEEQKAKQEQKAKTLETEKSISKNLYESIFNFYIGTERMTKHKKILCTMEKAMDKFIANEYGGRKLNKLTAEELAETEILMKTIISNHSEKVYLTRGIEPKIYRTPPRPLAELFSRKKRDGESFLYEQYKPEEYEKYIPTENAKPKSNDRLNIPKYDDEDDEDTLNF